MTDNDNVVHAFGAAPPDEMQKEMLAEVELMVEEIKAGRILGIAIAAVTADGFASTAWARKASHHFALIGACERLKMRLLDVGSDL